MMKRNDGYALLYVLVAMLILAGIAVAVMTMSLQVLKNQQSSIERMQDKYEAQGLAEQVVAQLEHAKTTDDLKAVIAKYPPAEGEEIPNPYCAVIEDSTNPEQYKLIASSGRATVTAEFTVEQVTKNEITGEDPEDNPIPTPTTVGHIITYISYKTEIAAKAEVSE